jgi:antitoxin component YwqK of YwqJK toxin-antitoxin module
VLNGKHTAYYRDGTIMEQATYRDNALTDLHCTYYPDGTLKEVTEYRSPSEESIFLSYHPNGEVMKVFRYDERTGELKNKIIFTEDGELFLWTLLDPKRKGTVILHLNADELKEIKP